MNNLQSKTFLKILTAISIFWFSAGYLYFRELPDEQHAFVVVNILTLIDLSAFIFLFWVVFFMDLKQGFNRVIFMFLLTFKLVCLGVLAIVLKRLENKTALASGAAIGIMGMGPMLAAIITQIKMGKGKNRGTRI